MTFLEQMQDYFRGERIEAFGYILPGAVVLFVLAATAVRSEGGAFGAAMAIPLVLCGLLLGGVGLGVGLRTPGQVAALEAEYAKSPKEMLEKEIPRMKKVNAAWPVYLGTWAVLVLLGVGIRFGLRAEWAQGLAPALIIVGAFGFLIDGFAERRARPYTEALSAQAAQHGVPQ